MSSPKPKRPKSSHHHSSFLHRLHQRHDERHHPGEHRHTVPEQEPLLQEEYPDSVSEAAPVEEMPSQWERMKDNTKMATLVIADTARSSYRKVSSATLNTAPALISASSKVKYLVTNNAKRILTFVCLLLALIAIAEGISMHYHQRYSVDVCTTPSCVRAASDIIRNLHPSVLASGQLSTSEIPDPCEDFDDYACGGFRLHYDLRGDQSELSTTSLMEQDVLSELHYILENEAINAGEAGFSIFVKMKDAYAACMDVTKLRDYGLRPLKTITEEIKLFFSPDKSSLRKAPLYQVATDNHRSDHRSFSAAFVYMARIGISALVSVDVRPDVHHSRNKVVFVSPAESIGLPSKDLYGRKDLLAQYGRVINVTLGAFYDIKPNTSALLQLSGGRHYSVGDLAREVVSLENKIAAIMPAKGSLVDGNKNYYRKSYSEAQDMIPWLSFESIIRELAPSTYHGTTLIVSCPTYLQNLSSIMDNTPNQVLQAFLVWKAIQEYADRIDDIAVESWKHFLATLTDGKKDETERRHTCVDSVKADVGWILTKFYLEKSLSQEFKHFTKTITRDVVQAFTDLLSHAKWMSSDDVETGQHKAQNIRHNIAYPTENPNVLNTASLERYYENVLIQNSTYLENKVQSTRGSLIREWNQLGSTGHEDEWPLMPVTVGAYYKPAANAIFLPAGSLRRPVLYESSVPRHLVYGTLGAIAGHEFAHAFGTYGSYFDKHGSYDDWWSNYTRESFESKTLCFIDQYSSYGVKGPEGQIYVNGSQTLEENLADAGGLRAAYKAWEHCEANKASQTLPGLENFSGPQIFFLSYAGRLCSKMSDTAMSQEVRAGLRTPKPIRIKGSLANSREFRKAFSCEAQAPTCEMW